MKKRKHIRFIFNFIYWFIILYLTTFILTDSLAPKLTMRIFRFDIYQVISESMEPVIKTNDAIFITKLNEDTIQEGDIINFNTFVKEIGTNKLTPITVTHYVGRITLVDGKQVYDTQSYNYRKQNIYDVWYDKEGNIAKITSDNINGEVLFVIPFLGHFMNILRNPIMLILIFITLFTFGILVKLILSYDKNDKLKS